MVYENAVRVEIARALGMIPAGAERLLDDENILDGAQERANSDLASIEEGTSVAPEELTDEEQNQE